MDLKTWLSQGRGRAVDLAKKLELTRARIYQMANGDGVPDRYKLAVRAFTKNAVSLEAMVNMRVKK